MLLRGQTLSFSKINGNQGSFLITGKRQTSHPGCWTRLQEVLSGQNIFFILWFHDILLVVENGSCFIALTEIL